MQIYETVYTKKYKQVFFFGIIMRKIMQRFRLEACPGQDYISFLTPLYESRVSSGDNRFPGTGKSPVLLMAQYFK
jgi:hypothetical protein